MKRTIALLLAAMCVFSMHVYRAEEAQTALIEDGILKGYPGGEVNGGESLSRAQAMALAMRTLGFDDVKWFSADSALFADVPRAHWASGYV